MIQIDLTFPTKTKQQILLAGEVFRTVRWMLRISLSCTFEKKSSPNGPCIFQSETHTCPACPFQLSTSSILIFTIFCPQTSHPSLNNTEQQSLVRPSVESWCLTNWHVPRDQWSKNSRKANSWNQSPQHRFNGVICHINNGLLLEADNGLLRIRKPWFLHVMNVMNVILSCWAHPLSTGSGWEYLFLMVRNMGGYYLGMTLTPAAWPAWNHIWTIGQWPQLPTLTNWQTITRKQSRLIICFHQTKLNEWMSSLYTITTYVLYICSLNYRNVSPILSVQIAQVANQDSFCCGNLLKNGQLINVKSDKKTTSFHNAVWPLNWGSTI